MAGVERQAAHNCTMLLKSSILRCDGIYGFSFLNKSSNFTERTPFKAFDPFRSQLRNVAIERYAINVELLIAIHGKLNLQSVAMLVAFFF